MKNLIANVYAVERREERENLKSWEKIGNRMLLWHGTRGENLIGILQTGFRIAPADARRTGSMFGEGLYFADIFNKSYQYAGTTNNHYLHRGLRQAKPAKRYMFLCEVALGSPRRLLNATQVTDLPNSEHQSVMGYGRLGPNPKGSIYMPNGCAIPLGKLQANPQPNFGAKNEGWGLQHNEFVVYKTSQVRIRYILELREV